MSAVSVVDVAGLNDRPDAGFALPDALALVVFTATFGFAGLAAAVSLVLGLAEAFVGLDTLVAALSERGAGVEMTSACFFTDRNRFVVTVATDCLPGPLLVRTFATGRAEDGVFFCFMTPMCLSIFRYLDQLSVLVARAGKSDRIWSRERIW